MKRNYKKLILIILVLVVFAGGFTYWFTFKQPHKNMLKTKPDFKITAQNIYSEFSDNENDANTKYLGKVAELTGKVVDVKMENNQYSIVLEDKLFGVSTYLDSSYCAANPDIIQGISDGKSITIRG